MWVCPRQPHLRTEGCLRVVGPSLESTLALRGDHTLRLYPHAAGVADDVAREVEVVHVAAALTAVDGQTLSLRADLVSAANNTRDTHSYSPRTTPHQLKSGVHTHTHTQH